MKPSHLLLILFSGLLLISCQKTPIEYDTAWNSCVKTHEEITKEGDTVWVMSNTDCILGAQLPFFTSQTLDGRMVTKKYFDGKVTVLNFWFEGCQPCEAEMPGLNKLVEKYKNEPVVFLAIGRNSPKDIQDFLLTHPFKMDQVAYGDPIAQGIFKNLWGYPLTIVADKQSKILFASSGGRTDSLAINAIQDALVPVIDEALKGS